MARLTEGEAKMRVNNALDADEVAEDHVSRGLTNCRTTGRPRMVELDLEDGLAVVTIDRPPARNAIGLDTMADLETALDAAEAERAPRAAAARLWGSEEHWEAAEKVMTRGK
ncbi:hypothetical protein ACFYWX_39885 [Streptomyces sp. NPDC002888]|uniref:hypothetical protein n=1 Tax=Streptomyces sp. NPDC002888 TaxID=3364668 RepID=UPI0036A1A20F